MKTMELYKESQLKKKKGTKMIIDGKSLKKGQVDTLWIFSHNENSLMAQHPSD